MNKKLLLSLFALVGGLCVFGQQMKMRSSRFPATGGGGTTQIVFSYAGDFV